MRAALSAIAARMSSRVGRRAEAQVESAAPRRRSAATTDNAEGAGGADRLPGAVDLDPLQGCRSSEVLVVRNRLLKSTFRPRPRVATDTIVQLWSGDADALLDCYTKKDLQIQAFSRAAEGIRTLDLLHGKKYVKPRFQCPYECLLVVRCDRIASDYREFWYRRGTEEADAAERHLAPLASSQTAHPLAGTVHERVARPVPPASVTSASADAADNAISAASMGPPARSHHNAI
jgi:hypothetical protein